MGKYERQPTAWLIFSAAEGHFNTDYQQQQETHLHHIFHSSSLPKGLSTLHTKRSSERPTASLTPIPPSVSDAVRPYEKHVVDPDRRLNLFGAYWGLQCVKDKELLPAEENHQTLYNTNKPKNSVTSSLKLQPVHFVFAYISQSTKPSETWARYSYGVVQKGGDETKLQITA